ncbi:MAG: S-methyl-5-thioribose kinase [Lagierella massiliensis]|nr:S-methyl-5-thioribose kinase [Lagierella massiliensis]
MTYRHLNEKDCIEYAVDKKLFKGNNIICEEIGDGNINYVYRLSQGDESYIFKQSDELLRSSQRPLSQNRADVEAFMLNFYNRIVPEFSPKLYFYDKNLKLIVMEDLKEYKNLRKELMEGKSIKGLSENLALFCVKSLMQTTSFFMESRKKRRLQGVFINEEMCEITEDLVLTEPFNDYKKRNKITEGLEDFVEKNIYNDRNLRLKASILKDKFINQKQCLIHGDLHSGSIFVKDGKLKIIDPEFATFAPMGYDLGNVLGNLFFSLAYSEIVLCDDENSQQLKYEIVKFIKSLAKNLNKYLRKKIKDPMFKDLHYINRTISCIIRDMYSYCGTEILRRTIGESKVLELSSIKDLSIRLSMDKKLINFSKNLIIAPESISSQNIVQVYELWDSNLNLKY